MLPLTATAAGEQGRFGTSLIVRLKDQFGSAESKRAADACLRSLPDRQPDSTARQAKAWDLAADTPARGLGNTFVRRLLLQSDVRRSLLGSLPLARVTLDKVLVPSRDMVARRTRGTPDLNQRVPEDCLLSAEVGALR
jgi:hypothetical protein